MPTNLTLTQPFLNCVYQRNNQGIASIPITGTAPGRTSVTATITRLQVGAIQTLSYALPIVKTFTCDASGTFSGSVDVPGGWYSLTLTAGSESVTLDHVGSGEVFIKFGHSYMDGGADQLHQLPAQDERVVTLLDDLNTRNFQFGKLTQKIGPQNGVPDSWGQFGDLLVSRLNVPVLVYGTAYGGSNLQMSLEVINGQPLSKQPPGYAGADSRQPFKPLEVVMDTYIPKTGIRAILFEHGYNDRGTSRAAFVDMLTQFITYVRTRWQMPDLAFIVVQEQLTAVPGSLYDIPTAQAQSDLISSFPGVFKGPDFNSSEWNGKFTSHDHLYGDMIDLFARQFADSVTATTFLTNSLPYGPSAVPGITYSATTINTLDWVIMVAAGLCLVGLFIWKNKLLTWGFLILALYAIARVSGKL